MRTAVARVCKNGHRFFKTSDCPACPICEKEREPAADFLASLAAPARRALEHQGLDSLIKVSKYSEAELEALHGMGPKAILQLKNLLKQAGLSFRKS